MLAQYCAATKHTLTREVYKPVSCHPIICRCIRIYIVRRRGKPNALLIQYETQRGAGSQHKQAECKEYSRYLAVQRRSQCQRNGNADDGSN